MIACEDGNKPNSNTTAAYDSLYAEISGEYELQMITSAVNVNLYPHGAMGTGNLISGTLPKGPLELYTVYVYFVDDGTGKTEYDLAGTEGFTRLVFNKGLISETTYGMNITGSLTILKNNATELEGRFEYSATNPDSTKFIHVKNGYFYYTTEN